MKNQFVKFFGCMCFIMAGLIFFSSCVNEDYDLSKEIDMEMTILKNMAVPVGDIQKIELSKVLSLDEENSMISTDADGDYLISFEGDPFSASVEVPSISLVGSDGQIESEPVVIHFPLSGFSGLAGNLGNHKLVYSDLAGSAISTEMDIEIDSEIPSEIIDIKSVNLHSLLKMRFSTNVGKIYVPAGFTLEFPEELHLIKSSDTESYSIENGNKVVISKDIAAHSDAGVPFELNITIDKIDIPAGAVRDGRLVMDEHVKVAGDLYVMTSDFSSVPEELKIDMSAVITGLVVESAVVKIKMENTMEATRMEIGEIPEFLSGGNVTLDLYDPSLSLKADNTSPLSFGVTADIVAYDGEASSKISLGKDDDLLFNAGTVTEYLITRRQSTVSQGVGNIVVPEIADLMKTIPENIAIEGLSVSAASADFITIDTGDEYDIAIEYGISAPLAFGEAMQLSFTQDINDLGLDFDGDVKSAVLTLDMVNSIPLSFDLKAVGLDPEGNVINGLTLEMDKSLASGTHTSPVATSVKITLKNTTGRFSLDGLRLTMNAAAPSAEHVGAALNENQGLELKNIVLSVPDGITVDL